MIRRFHFAVGAVLLAAAPVRAQQPDEGFVPTADGTRLFYQKLGRGPVVLVPGRLFIFDDIMPLADRYTIIAYDMRNRGRSDAVGDSTRVTLQDDVTDLETVRRYFGVEKASLVGYSYLGLMVTLYAAAHPSRVDRVAQIGPVPLRWDTQFPPELTARGRPTGADSTAAARLRSLDAQGYATSNPKEFCELEWSVNRFGLVGDPANVSKLGASKCDMQNEWPVHFRRHLRWHFGSIQRTTFSWSQFSPVTMPVLTIHGRLDRNAAYGGGREWAANLPNARLLTVSTAAHQVASEYPEIVLPALRAFLAGGWPPAAEELRR